MQFQEINELLAKGIKKENMSADCVMEVDCANDYLLNRVGIKPKWLDDFFESNRCKLVETICRATSIAEGISSLQGYSEGYFNEIIQNANDLHTSNYVDIDVTKNGDICSVSCKYDDNGFSISNVYAFLNREMSDKTLNESQTGKFGVGIKSFFKFVNNLSIHSNVIFDFQVKRNENDSDVGGVVNVNDNWKDKTTLLDFSYSSTYQSGFNTSKLTKLITYLDNGDNFDFKHSFIFGEDDEVVFDIKSLMFMKLNAKEQKSVSKIVFRGRVHSIILGCDEVKKTSTISVDNTKWDIGIFKLYLLVDNKKNFANKYILFSSDKMTFAFPMESPDKSYNRMYSTYYLKKDTEEKILPMGMLVDSGFANMHRNDVGNSEETINNVYNVIKKQMHKLYECMCSENIGKSIYAEEVSDVFHRLLLNYLEENSEERWESPYKCTYCNNSFLPKVKGESVKKYIVCHGDDEAYDTTSFKEGNIVQELREEYFDYVEKKEVYDSRDILENENCIVGVKSLIRRLVDSEKEQLSHNYRGSCCMSNFFNTVGEFLSFKISGRHQEDILVSDAEVDNWLIDLKREIGSFFNPNMFLKLVGRYQLNEAIAFDGSVRHSNLSFKDYLFNGVLETKDGILAKEQNRQFDEIYYQLKQELLRKRYIDTGNEIDPNYIRCIKPTGRSVAGWDGAYDYHTMQTTSDMHSPLSQPELLLEKMAMDKKFVGLLLNNGSLQLFEKKARKMWRRNDYNFKNSRTIEQQIINLTCIRKVVLDSFSNFIKSIKYRSMLHEDIRDFINISCRQDTITTLDIINELLPVMVEMPNGEKKAYLLDEFSPADVFINSIEENSNDEIPKENKNFILKTTGYIMHIYHFDSNSTRKIIAYLGNGKCAIRTDASKAFREVATYNVDNKNIYVFYDNFVDDIQSLVTIILNKIGVRAQKIELLSGYIHNGNNTKTMNYISRRRNLAKVRKKLVLDWANIEKESISPIYDNEILYRLLTARGSYDIFCPICADIPLEIFEYGEDSKKKHSRKIIVLENENPDTNKETPYIITVACSYCCERLKSTLNKSEFDGKNVILTTQVAHGLHEKMKSKQQVELSPINIEVMKRFKL